MLSATRPCGVILFHRNIYNPQQVRRLGARPGAGELVQLRSALADFRQWLEDEQGAERPVPMAEFEKRAGAFSRALSALKPPA